MVIINPEPRETFVIFGNGHYERFYKYENKFNDDGEEEHIFYFEPTEALMNAFPEIRRYVSEENPGDFVKAENTDIWYIFKKYGEEFCTKLRDDSTILWLVEKSFVNGETKLSKKHQPNAQMISTYKQMIQTWQDNFANSQDALKNVRKAYRQELREMMTMAREFKGLRVPNEEPEDEDI